jgi:hypothetical protein
VSLRSALAPRQKRRPARPWRALYGWLPIAALIACCTSTGLGITADEALARARAELPNATEVVSIEAGAAHDFVTGGRPGHPDRPVWAVTLKGEWDLSCPVTQNRQPCDARADTAVVLVDRTTGEVVLTELR